MKVDSVLVIGGAGYIGSSIVEKLLMHGYRVRVFDRFIFGKRSLIDLRDKLEIIEGDIRDIRKLKQTLTNVDVVIHLAGIVGDPACSVDPNLTVSINIEATKLIKLLAIENKIPRFIYASSCSVYGASNHIVNESDSPNPVSLYAATKVESENELLKEKTNTFNPTILRFATLFGHSRRPRFDLVANLFTAQAYFDGIIQVMGSKQWRPFIYVGDVAEAVLRTIRQPFKNISYEIFNVGDDRLNIRIGELAQLVKEIVERDRNGKRVKIVVNENIKDRRNYFVSFQKIRTKLNFKATTDLRQGIEEILYYLRNGAYAKNYRNSIFSNIEMTKRNLRDLYKFNYSKF